MKLRVLRSGTNLSSAQLPVKLTGIVQTATGSLAPVVDAGNANPENNFRFSSELGGEAGYIFNLATRGLSAGTYDIRFRVGSDPSVYTTPIQIR